MTDAFAILPMWSLIAYSTEALAVPGGVLVRSFTQADRGDPPTTAPAFVPGVTLEPEVMTDGRTTSYARLVALPREIVRVESAHVYSAPSREWIDSLGEALSASRAGRRARTPVLGREPSTPAPIAEALAMTLPEGTDRDAPTATLASGQHFTVDGALIRITRGPDRRLILELLEDTKAPTP